MFKRLLLLGTLATLAACTNTEGLSKESSKTVHPQTSDKAVVQLSEYADLQCPACRAAHTLIVKPLIEEFGNQISYELNHFPLSSIHRFAINAAQASECAADQGKFWEYIDHAYEYQHQLNNDVLTDWAETLNLDTELFDRCLSSKIKKSAVMDNYDKGRELGVSGTPSFFVNGERVETDLETLRTAIKEALADVTSRL